MKHGSLFSGIGGFDLAAEWMGWENIFHCEINPFCQKVLKHYWPNSIQYNDITKTDFTIHKGQIDILTGGFPCQPYSSAGKRLGKEDSRHLWPQMLRSIREIKPKYILGENVFGLLNWNGGVVFNEVHSDLEAEGYEVQAVVIPAAAVNAPHGRDRVWFVAYLTDTDGNGNGSEYQFCTRRNVSKKWINKFGDATDTNGNGFNGSNSQNEINASEGGKYAQRNIEQSIVNRNATDTESGRTRGLRNKEEKDRTRKSYELFGCKSSIPNWNKFPTQSPVCGGNDGLPTELDGITFSKWRNESIRGYGNAVVPQVVYQIFKAIEKCEIYIADMEESLIAKSIDGAKPI